MINIIDHNRDLIRIQYVCGQLTLRHFVTNVQFDSMLYEIRESKTYKGSILVFNSHKTLINILKNSEYFVYIKRQETIRPTSCHMFELSDIGKLAII